MYEIVIRYIPKFRSKTVTSTNFSGMPESVCMYTSDVRVLAPEVSAHSLPHINIYLQPSPYNIVNIMCNLIMINCVLRAECVLAWDDPAGLFYHTQVQSGFGVCHEGWWRFSETARWLDVHCKGQCPVCCILSLNFSCVKCCFRKS